MAGKIQIILFIFLLTAWSGCAQKNIIPLIEKGQGLKVDQSLRKSLRKDSLNAESWYLLSTLYFHPQFRRNNIDSANRFVLKSIRLYRMSSPRQRVRMKKRPLDSLILVEHKEGIDQAGFDRAALLNTEEAYTDFLNHFSTAKQRSVASRRRDELLFSKATKNNSISGWQAYLSKYPSPSHVQEAQAQYEKLVYEDVTRDGKQRSYEIYLKENSTGRYAKLAEKNIFEIATARGDSQALTRFIESYPVSVYRQTAINLLYHVSRQQGLPFHFYNDSLTQVSRLEKGYWVPFLREHQFGFMDEEGNEMITPRYADVANDYLCGDVRTDYLIVEGGIAGRNGARIYQGADEDVEDMGFGFLKIKEKNGLRVIHKSGFLVTSELVDDARIIDENFIAVKVNKRWALISFTGKELLPRVYESITVLDELIILERNGKKIIATKESIAATADKIPFSDSFVVDDVRLLEREIYLVKNGSLEGAINSNLQYVVPLERQILSKTPYGFISEKDRKFRFINVADVLQDKVFDKQHFYGNWISLSSSYNLQLFDVSRKKMIDADLDSIWFSNRVAFTLRNDSVKAYLSSGKSLSFLSENDVTFMKSPDSVKYLYSTVKNKKVVFDITSGTRLFSLEALSIEYLGHDVFLFSGKNGKGLVSAAGNVILPPDYNAIAANGDNSISLLKGKKFGLYNLKRRILIKPDYDRNIKSYNSELLVAYRDGFYGLITWQSQPRSKFEFEEIKNWNDREALVKKDFYWAIYSIEKQELIQKLIKNYQLVSETEDEKLMIILQDNYYGVMSSTRGMLITPGFTGITNIGSVDVPLYLAEKHVEEAGVFIVIYYDGNGKLLRRQVYEENEYLKISCADN